jgi:hypothetical protein
MWAIHVAMALDMSELAVPNASRRQVRNSPHNSSSVECDGQSHFHCLVESSIDAIIQMGKDTLTSRKGLHLFPQEALNVYWIYYSICSLMMPMFL